MPEKDSSLWQWIISGIVAGIGFVLLWLRESIKSVHDRVDKASGKIDGVARDVNARIDQQSQENRKAHDDDGERERSEVTKLWDAVKALTESTHRVQIESHKMFATKDDLRDSEHRIIAEIQKIGRIQPAE